MVKLTKKSRDLTSLLIGGAAMLSNIGTTSAEEIGVCEDPTSPEYTVEKCSKQFDTTNFGIISDSPITKNLQCSVETKDQGENKQGPEITKAFNSSEECEYIRNALDTYKVTGMNINGKDYSRTQLNGIIWGDDGSDETNIKFKLGEANTPICDEKNVDTIQLVFEDGSTTSKVFNYCVGGNSVESHRAAALDTLDLTKYNPGTIKFSSDGSTFKEFTEEYLDNYKSDPENSIIPTYVFSTKKESIETVQPQPEVSEQPSSTTATVVDPKTKKTYEISYEEKEFDGDAVLPTATNFGNNGTHIIRDSDGTYSMFRISQSSLDTETGDLDHKYVGFPEKGLSFGDAQNIVLASMLNSNYGSNGSIPASKYMSQDMAFFNNLEVKLFDEKTGKGMKPEELCVSGQVIYQQFNSDLKDLNGEDLSGDFEESTLVSILNTGLGILALPGTNSYLFRDTGGSKGYASEQVKEIGNSIDCDNVTNLIPSGSSQDYFNAGFTKSLIKGLETGNASTKTFESLGYTIKEVQISTSNTQQTNSVTGGKN